MESCHVFPHFIRIVPKLTLEDTTVSLLPIISKVMESITAAQFKTHFFLYSLICNHRGLASCTQAISPWTCCYTVVNNPWKLSISNNSLRLSSWMFHVHLILAGTLLCLSKCQIMVSRVLLCNGYQISCLMKTNCFG